MYIYIVMKFKKWLLKEMSWHSFPKTVTINGIKMDGIDFRFEDWGKGTNTEKTDIITPTRKGMQYVGKSFSAPLFNGTYINVCRGNDNNSPKDVISLKRPEIAIEPHEMYEKLPNSWWDFAIGLLGNEIVKAPEWKRETDIYKSNPSKAQ